MTIPYTYAIRCRSTGQRYYGVRYHKGCSPADLWVEYFTSSKPVKKLIERYGLGDFEVQVRKVFETPEAALSWEYRFLKKIDVLNNPEWLNMSVGGMCRVTQSQARQKSYYRKGRARSQNEVENRKLNYQKTTWVHKGETNKLVRSTDIQYYLSIGFTKGRNEAFKTQKFIDACHSRKGENNPAFGLKRPDLAGRNKDRCWVTNGSINNRILKEELSLYLAKGFVVGRSNIFTEVTKEKLKKAARERPKKVTEEMAKEIRCLKSEGNSNVTIGKMLGISASTVWVYVNSQP